MTTKISVPCFKGRGSSSTIVEAACFFFSLHFRAVPIKVSSAEQDNWLSSGKIFFLAQWRVEAIGWRRSLLFPPTQSTAMALPTLPIFSQFSQIWGTKGNPGWACGLSSYVLQRGLAAAGETSLSSYITMLFFLFFRSSCSKGTPLILRRRRFCLAFGLRVWLFLILASFSCSHFLFLDSYLV